MDALVASIVADPVLVGAALPFAVGFGLAVPLRLAGDRRGGGLAPLAALAAFLLAYGLIEGLPPLLAVTAKQKLFWLALAGGALGLVAWSYGRGSLERVLLVALPMVGLLWLGQRQWLRGPEAGFVIASIILWLSGAAILLRLRATDPAGHGFTCGAQLVVAATGLSLIALIGASASLATLSGALAAGLGGVLLLDYAIFLTTGTPTRLGAVGRLGVGASLFFVAAVLVLYTEGVGAIAIALLSLVFVSGRIPLRFRGGASRFARAAEPVRAAMLAAIPAALAVIVAFVESGLVRYP